MGDACDLGILVCYSFNRVNYQHCHVTSLYSRNSSDNTVSLYIFLYLTLSSESRSIYEYIFCAVSHDLGIYCVPCGSRNIRNDNPVLSKELIYDRRFTNIGLTYYGYSWSLVLSLILGTFREILNNLIKHIAYSKS